MNYIPDDAAIGTGPYDPSNPDPAEEVAAGRAWGMELVLDLFGCDPLTITSPAFVRQVGLDLCAEIGMRPYGEAQTPWFGAGDPKTDGLSLTQLIETSLISLNFPRRCTCQTGREGLVSGHFSTEWRRYASMNVYSCQRFDVPGAVAFLRNAFHAEAVTARALARGVTPRSYR